jgi:hypothetical protein
VKYSVYSSAAMRASCESGVCGDVYKILGSVTVVNQ